MTPTVLDPPRRSVADGSLEALSGGRVTLEERLARSWRALRTHGTGDCPVCHGRMSMHAGRVDASCADCGSLLS
jgi:hypothetical protein